MEQAGVDIKAAQEDGSPATDPAAGVLHSEAPVLRRSLQAPDAPGVEVVEPSLTLTDRMEIVEAKMVALEEALNNLGAPKPFDMEEADGFVPEHDAPEEYVKLVHEICGKGFGVKTEPHKSGTNFRLIITPPPTLREIKDSVGKNALGQEVTIINDRRVKIIALVEGSNGVRDYATKVRDFCIRWAFKNGVNYGKKG